jgi:glutathione S-transferase
LAKLADVLDALDAWPGGLGASPTIGAISVAVALGYLDWRLPAEDWHAGRPALSAWYATFAARPSMRASAPQGEPA